MLFPLNAPVPGLRENAFACCPKSDGGNDEKRKLYTCDMGAAAVALNQH